MSNFIDLSESKYIELPFFNEEQARELSKKDKGWSYSYVYHFTELKDIFIALRQYNKTVRLQDFTKYCLSVNLPYYKTIWTERRVLEHLNAWKNFDFFTSEYEIKNDVFKNSVIGSEITDEDLLIFKAIYFSYFRFKEIHSWLLDPNQTDHKAAISKVTEKSMTESSRVIYPFFKSSKFTDSFLFELKKSADVFCIKRQNNQSNEDIMRFWDVYIKWGQALKIVEKFSLKDLDYHVSASHKSIACAYFISKKGLENFDLLTFIKEEYSGNYIHIPRLLFRIATKFRLPVNIVKDEVIKQALANNHVFSLQRTSEVFIRNKEMNFVPIHKDSYISHLLLQ